MDRGAFAYLRRFSNGQTFCPNTSYSSGDAPEINSLILYSLLSIYFTTTVPSSLAGSGHCEQESRLQAPEAELLCHEILK